MIVRRVLPEENTQHTQDGRCGQKRLYYIGHMPASAMTADMDDS